MLTLIGVLIIPNYENPNYKRIFFAYPIIFSTCMLVEKYIETSKFVKDYSFIIYQLIWGASTLNGIVN